MRKLALLALGAICASGIYFAASKSKPKAIIFGKGNQLIVAIQENGENYTSTEWRRNLECASKPEEMEYGYGEIVALLGHKGGNFLMTDYDCDGKVDWYIEFSKGEYERSRENEAGFLKADRLFMEAKQEIRKHVDLDKILEEWLKEKKK